MAREKLREVTDFFEARWKAGLAEHDDYEGIAWRWKSIDGAMMRVPLAQSSGRVDQGVQKDTAGRKYRRRMRPRPPCEPVRWPAASTIRYPDGLSHPLHAVHAPHSV